MRMVLEGERGGLFVRPGQSISFGGLTWRIVSVAP
jgi:hypothetical protein